MRTGLIALVLLTILAAVVIWIVVDREEGPDGNGAKPDPIATEVPPAIPDPAASPARPENAPAEAPPSATTPEAGTAANGPGLGGIRGRVRFVGTAPGPVVGAKVFVLNEATGHWKQTTTNTQGDYRMADLTPAGWKARVVPPEHPRLPDVPVTVAAGPDTVRDFEVPCGTVLTGRVLDDVTGEGVAGATLMFLRPVRHTVKADAEGAYRVVGVTSWMLSHVEVKAAGYNTHYERTHFGRSPPAAAVLDIRLNPLARVEGVVLDPAGAPVAGAKVRRRFDLLFKPGAEGPVTDDRGRFALTVPTVQHRHFEKRVTLFAYREGFAYGMTRTATYMDGEHVRDVEIRLRPGGAVSGRVRSATAPKQAVAHCWTTSEEARRCDRDRHRTDVGADGGFAFRDLPPGPYQVQVRAANAVTPIHTIAVEAGRTCELQVDLVPNRGVIRGLAVDGNGAPVAGARVTILRHPHPFGTPKPKGIVTLTDAEGRFRAERLEDLTYWVFVSRGGRDEKHGVRPGPNELRFVVRRTSAVYTRLHGTVVDDDGVPLAKCGFGVYEDLGDRMKEVMGRQMRLQPLTKGTFRLLVKSEPRERRLWIEAVTHDGRCSPRRPVTVSPGLPVKPVKLVVAKGATVHGRVLDPSGTPIPGVNLELTGEQNGIRGYSESSIRGEYEFTTFALPAGRYRIRAKDTHWDGPERSFTLRHAESLAIDITLEAPSAEVSLLVRTPEGRPVAGAEVSRNWPDVRTHRAAFEAEKRRHPGLTWHDFRLRFVTTDADGRWSRKGLTAGPSSVHIRAAGFRDREVKFTLRKGERRTLQVVLQRSE